MKKTLISILALLMTSQTTFAQEYYYPQEEYQEVASYVPEKMDDSKVQNLCGAFLSAENLPYKMSLANQIQKELQQFTEDQVSNYTLDCAKKVQEAINKNNRNDE